MSKKSFVKGAAILGIAGLLAKFIGAFFRIPLMNIVHEEGMGLYQMAYPIYAFLLTISTSGLPTAISKLVSEKIALQDYRSAHRIFTASLQLLTWVGMISSLILLAGSGLFARILGDVKSFYSLLAIAPALFFVSVLSAFRGYFQGMQIMTPTAVSQLVEQFGKALMGLSLAALWIPKGVEYGAAGAVLGVTLSEVAALVFMLGVYRRERDEIWNRVRRVKRSSYIESNRTIIGRVLTIAIPVTIGASIMPLVNLADAAIVVNRLKQIGLSQTESTGLYGLLTGGANPLINFPAILTIALAMSLVPAISESFAVKDAKGVKQKTNTGIRLTLLMGLPAAAGMAVLAVPICQLLYGSLGDQDIRIMGSILAILSIGVVFLTLVQTLTGILQGIGQVSVPVRNLFIGALFKVIISYILVGIPEVNVAGAAIGTVVCYGVAAVLDFIAVARYTGVSVPFDDFFIRPAVAVGVMGLLVRFSYDRLMGLLGSNSKAVLIAIVAGVLVYGVMLLLTGAVRKQDFELMPRAKKLGYILERMGMLRR